MVDEQRILTKIDELDAYLEELRAVAPENFKEYERIEKKRSCERLLQIYIECVIDICKVLVSGMRLGLPSDENDLFLKLHKRGVVSGTMWRVLRQMRGFRNILIHEIGAGPAGLAAAHDLVRQGMRPILLEKGKMVGGLARQLFQVPFRPYPQEDSSEQWISNRFGDRLYRTFFKTYTEKVWGIPCSEKWKK